jgi:hypothetical protein
LSRELTAASAVSDWLSGSVRYQISTGVDSWSGGRKAVSIAGSTRARRVRRSLSLSIAPRNGRPQRAGSRSDLIGAHAIARSSAETRGWVVRATAGFERGERRGAVCRVAGAGEGQVRGTLLRAHPLAERRRRRISTDRQHSAAR